MIKSSNNLFIHPLLDETKKTVDNRILDYRWRTRRDVKFIPQYFNNKIVFYSWKSFQQNNLNLGKMIHKYTIDLIKTKNIISIGGESYLYGNGIFYTNNKTILEDSKYNGVKCSKLIDYNKTKLGLNGNDIIMNLSKLNVNLLKQINNSCSNRIIIINCHHKDFWKKIKYLSNYKLISRKQFIDFNIKYFITVNLFIKK